MSLEKDCFTITAEPKEPSRLRMMQDSSFWLKCLERLVSKTDFMRFAHLVKQASVDYWYSFTTGQSVWHTVLRHRFYHMAKP